MGTTPEWLKLVVAFWVAEEITMSKTMKVILALVGAFGVLGVGLWRYQARGQSDPAHAVIIRDRSDSVLTNCDCTRALVSRALAAPRMGGGSTLTVMVTGDSSTG